MLRDCASTEEIIKTAVLFISDAAMAIDGQNVTLNVDFCHVEGEVVVENEVEPDCVNNGSYDEVIYCTICGEELSRETITVDALGHTAGEAVIENEIASTCTEEGSYDTVVYCSVCGEELERTTTVVPVIDHTYEAVVTAPTCVDKGFTTYTCECGDSYIADYVDALGHTAGKVVIVDATAAKDGSKTTYCAVCGEIISVETIAKPEGKVVVTATSAGKTILTGIVNADYSASVSVPKGSIIDTSSITGAISMTDVAGLGIEGTKTFERTLATGLDKVVALDNYLPSFTSATVSGKIDGVEYGYTFTGTDNAEEFRIDAVPQDADAVAEAWAAMTSHMTTAEKGADDSYVIVPGEAYIQIGTEKLVFADTNASTKLDNIVAGSGITADIRAAVELLEVEELEDAQIKVFLPAGTVLALGSTEVTLVDDATITVYGY